MMNDDDTIVNLETCKIEETVEKKSKQNFYEALNYLKIHINVPSKLNNLSDKNLSKTIEIPNTKKQHYDKIDYNVSDYSITQANFSIEEHAVNVPLNRNFGQSNYRFFKNNHIKKNFTHANIPYLTRTKSSMHSLYDEVKDNPNESPQELLKDGFNSNRIFKKGLHKVKGSTTYDSKKTNSNMKYVSFEEFQNFNNSQREVSRGDESISKIMKSFNDYDINDLDVIRDIYLDNSKGSVVTRKLEPNDLKNFKDYNFSNVNNCYSRSHKSRKSVCSMPFKLTQSNNNSKMNCSKILVVDSKNISLNLEYENKLTEGDISFKRNESKKNFNINNDFIQKTGKKTKRKDESIEYSNTVSKKIHKSRISRIKSRESENNTINPLETDKDCETDKKMSFKNANFVSENKSHTSRHKNSFQLSNILNKMKFNFETINESQSEKDNNSRRINRNLLDHFNDLDSNQDILTPNNLNSKKISFVDENNFFTPRERIRKGFNDPFDFNFHERSVRSEKTLDESLPLYSTIYDIEFVNNMLKQDDEKLVDPDHLNNHPLLKSEFRSILINWLIELSEEFAFKRDTLHYAARYIDMYLSNSTNFSNTKLQLLGIVALSLAAKIEEIQIPKTEDYILATDKSFSMKDFNAFEKEFLITIKWKLIPSNINLWLNWYLCQWDVYLDSFEDVREKFLLFSGRNNIIYFKKPDEETYFIYRQITQLIDLIVLDVNYLNFSLREIVAASLFIIIGMNLNIFDESAELNDMNFLLKVSKNNYFADIFTEFLYQSFGFKMQSIYLAIIFVSKFTRIKFSTELPLIAQTNEDIVNYGHYEEFLAYQAYNPENYFFISNHLNK